MASKEVMGIFPRAMKVPKAKLVTFQFKDCLLVCQSSDAEN